MMGILGVLSRSIVDPVAKHDSNQCAVYLCKEHPDMATEYLNGGCEGDFGDFIQKSHKKMIEETQFDIVKDSSCNIDEKPIDPLSFIMMVTTSSCISLVIGLIYSKYENEYLQSSDEEEEEQELVEKEK